jgi:VIT1/CCC1 family predicted Fe2+/Mn2+ transporter
MESTDMRHLERHRSERIGWLRAAVLGANDGIVSTSSLVLGVAAADAAQALIVVAGAMSMAAGEYVSVSSQADTEASDLARERRELASDAVAEHAELAAIYVDRGLTPALAREVAGALMTHDALGAHARDELGLVEHQRARPLQAAAASAATFAAGAGLPLVVVLVCSREALVAAVLAASLLMLAILGGLAARVGGASVRVGATRVAVWGALAMASTWAVGMLFGAAVA